MAMENEITAQLAIRHEWLDKRQEETIKKLVKDYTEEEKDHMFRGTATRVYQLAS